MHTRVRQAVRADAPQMAAVLNSIIEAGGTTVHQTPFNAERMDKHHISPSSAICTHVTITNARLSGFQSFAWQRDADDPLSEG